VLLRKIFFYLLGISYVILGIFVYLKKVLPAPWDLVFGIACVVYGIWRIYRGTQIAQMDIDERG
jgi:hypothetical protein